MSPEFLLLGRHFLPVMTTDAIDIGQKHRTRHLGKSQPRSLAGIDLQLASVLRLVTEGAVEGERGGRRGMSGGRWRRLPQTRHRPGGLFLKAVFQLLMTVEASNVMLGDVVFMDKRHVIVPGQFLRLVVAGEAAFLLRLSLAPNDVEVAITAGDPLFGDKILVVVAHVADLKRPGREE